MIDGGVIAGYLGLAVARAAGRFVDRRLDGGLDALTGRIRLKFGSGPEWDLARRPGQRVYLHVATAIEQAARRDARFADDISGIVDHLDRLGGHQVTTNVRAHTYMHHQGSGDMAYGNIYKPYYSSFPGDPSHSPAWVKALVVIGTLAGLVGFAILAIGFFTIPGGPGAMKDASDIPNIGLGVGVFFGGAAMLALGQTIAMVTKRQ